MLGVAGDHGFTRTSKDATHKAFHSLKWLSELLTGLALHVTGTRAQLGARSLDRPVKAFGE